MITDIDMISALLHDEKPNDSGALAALAARAAAAVTPTPTRRPPPEPLVIEAGRAVRALRKAARRKVRGLE